jgi:hypothetical protein
MLFIKPSPEDIARALESWGWLPIQSKEPVLVTAFGDIFLESSEGIWFLDTLEGNLVRVCNSMADLKKLLATEEAENHYLFAGFVERAHHEGMLLEESECYDFKLNPIVGGKIEYENIEPRNFVVAVNIAGQLHEQTKNMPPGTKITGFTIKDETKPTQNMTADSTAYSRESP